MVMDVGFIGLGQMGSAIAEQLVAAGHNLHVHDPNPTAARALVEQGAEPHPDPRCVANRAEIIFVCLPSAEVSEGVAREVALGSRARILVEMSTIGRPAVERLAGYLGDAGIKVVDAPISGGPKGARNNNLAIMAAGADEDIAEVMPLLNEIGSQVFVVDQRPGRGQVMKVVNNLISGAIMAVTYETLVMGTKAGLDPDIMIEVLNASSARNSATLQKVPCAILTGTFDFGASVRTITKDVSVGLDEARTQGVPMWVSETVVQLWRFAECQADPENDYTTLIRFMEDWAGTKVRRSASRVQSSDCDSKSAGVLKRT